MLISVIQSSLEFQRNFREEWSQLPMAKSSQMSIAVMQISLVFQRCVESVTECKSKANVDCGHAKQLSVSEMSGVSYLKEHSREDMIRGSHVKVPCTYRRKWHFMQKLPSLGYHICQTFLSLRCIEGPKPKDALQAFKGLKCCVGFPDYLSHLFGNKGMWRLLHKQIWITCEIIDSIVTRKAI